MPELIDYLKAGYPFLFIRTVEPDAAEEMVLNAAQSIPELMQSGKFMVWKATKILENDISNTKPARESRNSNIVSALDIVEKATTSSQVVGVFHNIRQPLQNNNTLVQKFVDVIQVAKNVGSHIICIGVDWEPPPELHNFVTFIDMPLPSKKDLMHHFSETLTEWIAQAKEDGRDTDIPKEEPKQKDLVEQAANAAVGMSMFNAESVIALSMVSKRTIDIPTISKQKAEEIRKSDVLTFIDVEDNIDDVGGFNVLKPWLSKRIRAFTPEAKEFGLSYPKGILLVGPSGTAKSMISKVIAHTLKLPAIVFDIGKVFRSLVGESEAATRLALRTIEAVAPCVVILEEVEKGFAGISGSGTNDSGVTSRVVSEILTWRQETKCYCDKTEILTKEGWKFFGDLSDERVATRSKDGVFEWQKPTHYINSPYKGKMVEFKTQTTDLLVTPDHNMLVQITRGKGRKTYNHIKPAKDLVNKGTTYRVPVSSVWNGADPEFFILPAFKTKPAIKIDINLWLKFFGMFLADGYTSGPNRVGITQLPISLEYEDVKDIVGCMPFKSHYSKDSFMFSNPQLHAYLKQFGKAPDKYIPEYILDLSSDKLRLLFEWMVKFDGHTRTRKKGGNKDTTYATVSKRLADNVQELLQKIGCDGSISEVAPRLGGYIKGRRIIGRYVLYDIHKRTAKSRYLKGNFVDYSGSVHCVTVPNGIVYVRKNGKPMWSGNSPVFFCMNANSVAGLPSMIYRRGRIDKVWATDLPMLWERKEIFNIHIRKVKRDPSKFNVDLLAESSSDFTGAEIEGCISDALYMAFDDNKELTTNYILQAIKDTVPQATRSAEEIEAIRDWAKSRATMVSSETDVEPKKNGVRRKVRLINQK